MPSDTQFPIPGEVYVAVTAERAELVAVLQNQLDAGRKLSTAEIRGLLELLRDLIDQRAAEREKLRWMLLRLKGVEDAAKGIQTNASEVLAYARTGQVPAENV